MPRSLPATGGGTWGGAAVTSVAAGEARRAVGAVRDDPAGRLQLAASFYDDRPGRPSIRAYRRAELAFMRWQIGRGVLAPLGGDRPGSGWWRAVNEGLLADAREASSLFDRGTGPPSRASVARWVEFLERPSPGSWYRAHNASVVVGYVEHRHLVEAELPVERFFMDVALGRVIFVHSLVLDPRNALGRWLWPAGPLLGDPRWRGADAFLSLRNVLPDRYPLTELSIEEVLSDENLIGRVIDYGVALPRVEALYEFAAADLDEPALMDFVADGSLVYAWPHEERHAWAAKPSALRTLVARLTAPP